MMVVKHIMDDGRHVDCLCDYVVELNTSTERAYQLLMRGNIND